MRGPQTPTQALQVIWEHLAHQPIERVSAAVNSHPRYPDPSCRLAFRTKYAGLKLDAACRPRPVRHCLSPVGGVEAHQLREMLRWGSRHEFRLERSHPPMI